MEKKRMLKLRSVVTAFNILIISCLVCYSCWTPLPESMNQFFIDNQTDDTLKFQVTKMYITDNPMSRRDLLLGLNRMGGHEGKTSMQIIEDEWKFRGDTIEIYRAGYLPIKWAAPLREMDDSIHHFFNENSW